MQPVVPESAIFGGRCADAVLGMRGQGQGCGLPLAETRDAGVCVWPQNVSECSSARTVPERDV